MSAWIEMISDEQANHDLLDALLLRISIKWTNSLIV